MEKTYVIKGKPEQNWLLVDANQQPLGRLATQIAIYLMGKHKPTYTPGVEMGDNVVVVNASHLRLTIKRLTTKKYYRVSQYPGGITETSLRDQLRVHPDRVIRQAVWGMLPHNRMGRQLLKNLKIYGGNEHPHEAQKPTPVA